MYKTPRKPKKWLFPAAHAREYEKRLQDLAKRLTGRVETLIKQHADSDEWYADWNRALMALPAQMAFEFEQAALFVQIAAQAVARFNGKQFHTVVKSAYGGDFVKSEPWLRDALDGWINANTALIKSIPADYINRLQNLIAQAAVNGTSQAELIKQIRQTYKLPHDRARLIANDQIGKLNGQLTRRRQQSLGIEKYRWRGTLDERERDSHLRREGRIFSWSEPPSGGHPGSEIRCFPGSVKVYGFPRLEKLYRRFYTGELIEMVLDNGVILPATPNHPILTPDGLKPVDALYLGDNVICCRPKGRGIINKNGHSLIPTFEQIFGTLAFAQVGRKVTGSSRDFHGDGTDGEVQIIDADRFLTGKADAALLQKLGKLKLATADVLGVWAFLRSDGALFKNMVRHGAFGGKMGGVRLTAALLLRHLTPLEFLGFAAAADMDAALNQPLTDGGAVDAEVFGNSLFAFACLIHGNQAVNVQLDAVRRGVALPFGDVYARSPQMAADTFGRKSDDGGNLNQAAAFGMQLQRVVQVRRREYFGHVYNLQTVSGYYNAQTVLGGNCRCWAEPIFPELEELDALLFGDGGDNRHYHAEMTRRGLKPEAGMPDLPVNPYEHYGFVPRGTTVVPDFEEMGTDLPPNVKSMVAQILREMPYHPTVAAFSVEHGLTVAEQSALYVYTRVGKRMNLNEYAPEKMPPDEAALWQVLSPLVDAALDKLPDYIGEVRRGMKWEAEFLAAHTVGAEVVYPNFTSTSVGEAGFGHLPIQLIIRSKHGKLIEAVSATAGQREVLFKRQSRFRVTGITQAGGQWFIHLEQL